MNEPRWQLGNEDWLVEESLKSTGCWDGRGGDRFRFVPLFESVSWLDASDAISFTFANPKFMSLDSVIFLAVFIPVLNTPDFEQLWITYCDLKRAQMNNIGARIAFKWDLSGCRRRDISGRRLIWPSEGRIWYLTGRDNRPQVEGKHHQELAVCNRPNLEAKLTLDDLMLTGPDKGYFWVHSTIFLSLNTVSNIQNIQETLYRPRLF